MSSGALVVSMVSQVEDITSIRPFGTSRPAPGHVHDGLHVELFPPVDVGGEFVSFGI